MSHIYTRLSEEDEVLVCQLMDECEAGLNDAMSENEEMCEDSAAHDIVWSVTFGYKPHIQREVRRRMGF